MKKDRSVALAMRYSIVLIFASFISSCSAKLIDIDKSLPRLNLSAEQLEVVKPKMEAVRDITDIYNEKKEIFAEELSNMRGSGRGSGRRGEFREKMKAFRKQRETYVSAIETRVAEIKTVLDEEQLAVFEKMKLPELDMPDMPGGRGQGRRGGGGGRGGGRRGVGIL